eukprot:3515666-Prymnesium_polylepis.2
MDRFGPSETIRRSGASSSRAKVPKNARARGGVYAGGGVRRLLLRLPAPGSGGASAATAAAAAGSISATISATPRSEASGVSRLTTPFERPPSPSPGFFFRRFFPRRAPVGCPGTSAPAAPPSTAWDERRFFASLAAADDRRRCGRGAASLMRAWPSAPVGALL